MSFHRKLLQTQPTGEGAWTLTNAIEQYDVLNRSFSTFGYGYNGMFFKPDGTKLYIHSATIVYEFDLSTPWDQETATFVQSLDVSGTETATQGIFFTPDGLDMFIIGTTTDTVHKFFLSVPWDISTATLTTIKSVSAQETGPSGIFFKPDGTKMYITGATGDDVNEYDLSVPWRVSSATYLQNFSIAAQEATPSGLFFKPDGSKMYVLGSTGDDVNEYTLLIPWDVSSATYSREKSIAAEETLPTGVFFKPDGTKMYLVGTGGDDVNEYDLSLPWDVPSATYLQNFSVAAEEITPQGLFFKPDGTKMYIVGSTGDYVNEYDLSTAWDVSTASYLQRYFVGNFETLPADIFFKPDGLRMYVVGDTGNDVNEYDLSVAWDVSTASWQKSKGIAGQEGLPSGVFFKPDGTKMYIMGIGGNDVNEYDLSTAWDVLSASFLQTFSFAAQETSATGIFFKPDGTKMYIVGDLGNDITQYTLPIPWDVSSATYLQTFSIAAQETLPSGLFFKPDGTKMYIVGSTGDDVNEYDLSIAWVVRSASFLQTFSVAAQESTPTGIFFKPDGTKMYITGATGDDVNEYDLSVAWDVSSATYLQNFSIGAQEISPSDVFFKPDGTKMYIIGDVGDDVNEYELGVAWNVSSASFISQKSIAAQEATPQGLFFKPDGTKMYVIGITGDDVNEYDLSIPWNVLSAEFLQLFSVAAQEINPTDISFKADGTKMYVIGTTGDDVNEYDLSTAWDISTASYLQNFSVALQTGAPYSMTFKPDGTILYINGNNNNLFSYVLPDPWNITSIIVPVYFSVSAQETRLNGLFFKPDGTKMYVIGWLGDDVNEYDLSIPWDVNSAVFLQLFSIAAQQATPRGVFFKPDGLKMYVIGHVPNNVDEYDLSTAWDVSTAVFSQLFSVAAQEGYSMEVFFKPDGTKMYITGATGDDVNEYDLSTPWDISTASYLQNFSIAAQETVPSGMFFKPDGLKMFITGQAGDSVYEYDLSTAWDISTASYLQNFRWVAYWDGTLNSVFLKPDGNTIYISGESNKVFMVDLT